MESGNQAGDVPPWKRELLSRRKACWNRPGGENRHFHPPVADMRLLETDQFSDSQDHHQRRRKVMVEEKPTAKKPAFRPTQHRPKEDGRLERDYNSDSSEELQYGPGIVSKLKTKYLSMTLRENQKRNVRPSLSALRRAASLENMLDEDADKTQSKGRFVKKNCENQKTVRVSDRHAKYHGHGSESMKRARSMDTLLRSDSKCKNGNISPSVVNEDSVIAESGIRDKCKNGVSEGELPPPDLVKQTLKIFEPSKKAKDPSAPTVIHPKPKPSPKPVAPAKPQFSKPTTKPSISPKPVLSPEKRAARPKPLPVKQVLPVVAPLSPVTKPEPPEKPPVHQRTFSPTSPRPTTPIAIATTPEEETVKYISQLALDNIGKEGTTVKFCFNDAVTSKSHLPGGQPELAQATNTALLRSSSPERPIKPLHVPQSVQHQLSSPPQIKRVAVIRPVVAPSSPSNKIQSHNNLTDREIEKNHINRVKSIEPAAKVISPPPPLPPATIKNEEFQIERKNNSVGSAGGGGDKAQHLWDKKPSWQSQNSIVFNFSDRKSIPDYIENDGQIFASRRTKVQLLNGNEDDADGCEEDFSGPPSPCNIRFIGDNILINGKSNLRKEPRQHKGTLRIQFNDEATTLFEYPADDYSCCDDSPTSLLPSPVSSMSLGGGSLSNYTPSKTGSVEGFELGVTRATPAGTLGGSNSSSSSGGGSNGQQQEEDDSQEQYLKPVDSNDITPWSQETAADILF